MDPSLFEVPVQAQPQEVVPPQLPLPEQAESEVSMEAAPLMLALPAAPAPQPLVADAKSLISAAVHADTDAVQDAGAETLLLATAPDAQPGQTQTGLESIGALRPDKTLEAPAQKSEPTPMPHSPAPAPREERAASILQQMRVQISAGTRSAVIQLSPPELGMVMIQIRMEEEKLRTVVRAERPEALEALSRHLPELRATLQQQGLQANDIHLELGLGNRDQAREEALNFAKQRKGGSAGVAALAAPEQALLARILAPRTDGVDLYA